jgi:hypothetical protein
MTIPAFLAKYDETKKYDCVYYPHPKRWLENSSVTLRFHKETDWSGYIKYLNDQNELSDEIKNLPNDYGGIYVFFIQGINLPFCERYLVYVGRAQFTKTENLRSRVKSYLNESKKQNGRDSIKNMFKYWKKYLYIRYFKLQDNELIKQGESALIKAILPPFNTEITNYKIKEPSKAF